MHVVKAFDKISLLRLAFNGLDDSELEKMAALTELCSYPPGHILCREGEYEEVFYLAEIQRLRGALAYARGHEEQASRYYEQAIETAERQGAKMLQQMVSRAWSTLSQS